MSLENDRRGVTPESIDPMTLFIIIEIFDFPPEKCQGVIFNQEKRFHFIQKLVLYSSFGIVVASFKN